MLDPFPNELVEAVEEACTIIENRCGTVRGIGPAMREALAAVLPLIEQRVIDKLAREAGEPPYEEWNPTRAVWLEAVACGVAAERARTAKLREALRILSDPDDPPFADWAFFHRAEDREEASQEFARAALAALAPERTTEPVTDGEPVTDEEAGS